MLRNNYRPGPRFRFRDQEFWAEGGLICIENRNDGDFKVITRPEAAARAIALNDELKYCTYTYERDELSKCVVNLCEAVKEAKRQGDPLNPDVRRQRIKDLKRATLITGPDPSSISIMGGGTLIGNVEPGMMFESDRFRNLRI